jgi:hypothetical protein
VLEANPLDDMINLVSTKYVMADGVLHDAQAFKTKAAN